jgi:multiple sugar transport system substrate-binding protein
MHSELDTACPNRSWHPCAVLARVVIACWCILAAAGCEYRPMGVDEKGQVLLKSVSWSATPTEAAIIMDLVRGFREAHPDIRVEHEIISTEYESKLLTSFAAGSAPDVFWISSGSARSYIARAVLYDMTPLIEADGIDLGDFYPATLDPFVSEGRYFSLPNDACSAVLFYNTEHFDSAGVSPPKGDWTFDDFRAAAQKLTRDLDGDGNVDRWGFVMPGDVWMLFPFVYSNGGRIFDARNPDNVLFNSSEAVQAIDSVLGLALRDRVAPLRGQGGDQDQRRGFQLGRVSMMVSGWWDMTDTDVYAPNLKYSVAPIPRSVQPATQVFATGTGIYAGSRNPRQAWEFVKYMTSRDAQLVRVKSRMAGPSRRSVGKDPYFEGREKDLTFLSTMETGTAYYGRNADILQDELVRARDRVMQELQTTQQALDQAKESFVRRIAER